MAEKFIDIKTGQKMSRASVASQLRNEWDRAQLYNQLRSVPAGGLVIDRRSDTTLVAVDGTEVVIP